MTTLKQLEAWFVTGSQNLYGPEVLKQVGAQSQEIARALYSAGRAMDLGDQRPINYKVKGLSHLKLKELDKAIENLKIYLVKAPEAADASPGACRRVDQVSSQLRQLLARTASPQTGDCSPGALLAVAFPDRLARQRPGSGSSYKLASGRGASLSSP